jgi:adenylate cyclase
MENDPIAAWLLEEAAYLPDFRSVLDGLIERLRADGLPLARVSFGVGMLHPEMLAAIYTWELGDLTVDRSEVPHGVETTEMYLNSPFRLLETGPSLVRRRLAGPEAEIDYPILQGIRDGGATDYLAMALPRSDGDANRCSFSIDRPEGFSEDELARLAALRPYVGVITELQSRARMTRSLLNLYLGPEAGSRVYNGQIKRGEGVAIRSVLWISDLRGFTHLSEDEPLERLTGTLNDYFSAMIEPVHAEGGEVLKLIGDGVLAIFRIEQDSDVAGRCAAALKAAGLALANMALLNQRRVRDGKPPLGAGIALHVGEAMYGNVGAQDRLDFTVIGPAVNLCARLQALAGERGEAIICSADFARTAAPPCAQSASTRSRI